MKRGIHVMVEKPAGVYTKQVKEMNDMALKYPKVVFGMMFNQWSASILRGEPLVAEGREGINGLLLSNALHLSAFLGKKVELSIDEELYYEELMKRVATSRRKTDVKAVFADKKGSYGGTK